MPFRNSPLAVIRLARIISVAALTGVLSSCSSTNFASLAQGDVTAWKCDKPKTSKDQYYYVPYNYIIQTPGDIIVASENDGSQRSTILNTSDADQSLPQSWILASSYTFEKTKDNGFFVSGNAKGYDGKSVKQELLLNPVGGKLKIQNGGNTTYLECSRVGNWKQILSNPKFGPNNEYINSRLSYIPFFRKKIGDPEFASAVAKIAFQNEDYQSSYNLLSPLPAEKLTIQVRDIIESSKKKLIDQDTSTTDVWEWNNSWQGSYYSDEEKAERCRNMSTSTYSMDGYKIINSTSQDRIGGTGLTCHGTLHVMKKEGALQTDKPADLLPTYYD